ncbi:unnamed protein product [Phytomonas sp. EM1]|nr:unnamed protein product [Phytomonas sp. EM1]|eukprot:CCW63156.1 unnamed protein product [Phytomonas sp. isolate EM1]
MPLAPAIARDLPFLDDFRTVTCVTWTALGRNLGIGTPSGFLIFSMESALEGVIRRRTPSFQGGPSTTSSIAEPAASSPPAKAMEEVFRRIVEGGVGLLGLHGQSSVVAVSGVRTRAHAATVRLLDASLPWRAPHPRRIRPKKETNEDEANEETETEASEGDEATDKGLGGVEKAKPRLCGVLAEARLPTTVAALHYGPSCVIVGLAGDPRVVGSHRFYVFDRYLTQKHVLEAFPPASNAFLQDAVAMASLWAPAVGAGMSINRLRVMLPGEKKGQLRLLTLKTATYAADAVGKGFPTTRPPDREGEVRFLLGDKLLHRSPLRAVAITPDGRFGVTIGEAGTKLRLLEFRDDNLIVERLTFERGRTAARVDSVSLHLILLPGVDHDDDEKGDDNGLSTPRALVACITDAGTLHLFLCDPRRQGVVHHCERALAVEGGKSNPIPFAFSVLFPQPTAMRQGCGLFVFQWDHRWKGLTLTAAYENGKCGSPPSSSSAAVAQWQGKKGEETNTLEVPEMFQRLFARLVVFDVHAQAPQGMEKPPQTTPSERPDASSCLTSQLLANFYAY